MRGKYRETAQALGGLLRDGERLVVTEFEGRIEVREFEDEDDVPSAPSESDPDFYGYLLVVNGRVSNATAACGLWST
jgi:hypothetical protein